VARRPRRLAVRVIASIVAVAAVWASVAGRVLVLSLPIAEPDAIVSLGSHEWERLPEAADAAARYPSALVVLTQPREVTIYNCHDCAHRVDRLVAAGVAASRVRMLALTSDTTRGEANACRRFADQTPIRRVLLVTSPYHTRRALAVFRDAFAGTGIEVGVEPATAYAKARPALWFTTAEDSWYVAYEWAALVYYGLRYGIPPAFDASHG